jgi:hypothetical protein
MYVVFRILQSSDPWLTRKPANGRRQMAETSDESALARAGQNAREGKSPSTPAGEFVREEIDHVREGEHGVRNVKPAIAMGLSKARRAGVDLAPPGASASPALRKKAAQDARKGRHPRKPSKARSRAVLGAMRRESTRTASKKALSRQARNAARRRGAAARSRSARNASRTRQRMRRRR